MCMVDLFQHKIHVFIFILYFDIGASLSAGAGGQLSGRHCAGVPHGVYHPGMF